MLLVCPVKSDPGREKYPARVRFFDFIGAKLFQIIIINANSANLLADISDTANSR